MIEIKSLRAKKTLESPRFFQPEQNSSMKRFPGNEITLWASLEVEGDVVKNLSLFGQLEDFQKVLFESMASLLINKPITVLDTLSIRECEAFLRDRNSENSLSEMSEAEEIVFNKVFKWLRLWPKKQDALAYHFSYEKSSFSSLKLVEKIKEIRAFLNSPEILTLYSDRARPELVDVEDLTVYIQAPYGSEKDRELFEELHILGIRAFQEESLNFIPDA